MNVQYAPWTVKTGLLFTVTSYSRPMNTQPLIDQLKAIVDDFTALQRRSPHHDLSDLPRHEQQALVTRAVAAVHRITGPRSIYANELQRLFATQPHIYQHISSIIGVVVGLLGDVKAGHMQALVDLVHAETFASFLDMAQHLLDSAYKDAAAVIAGSALEAHLRTLCERAGSPTEMTKGDGTEAPKKADALNVGLASGGRLLETRSKECHCVAGPSQ